ncbi:serine protease family protein [Emydomyces testavorans]|uniref:Serine protease family protein n=1 Tax=Emydomyces testavorans TaxID=2070801 RepID=A0AAF0DL13_9EURO|nr:serine protease family protein [Emydomyces testavorans]
MAKLLAIAAALAVPALTMPAVPMTGAVGTPGQSPPAGELQVVGGTRAKPGQFPSIITLDLLDFRHCAAVLLNAKTAVTAGHCVRPGAENLRVRAGTNVWCEGGIKTNVSAVITHPDIHLPDNDIAVIHLTNALPKSSAIGYANLPPQGSDPAPKTKVTVAGWGETKWEGNVSRHLLYATVAVTERPACKKLFAEKNVTITDSMVCASARGKDSCNGDSGGPLYDAAGTLVGIVSFGVECADKYGGVYTRVGKFVDWIKENSLPA